MARRIVNPAKLAEAQKAADAAQSARRKYRPDNMMPFLRIFAEARAKALAAGFTDNGGAIHSIERILTILAQRVCFPHLTHTKDYKGDAGFEISAAAYKARLRGDPVRIEHVLPQRAFARQVCNMVKAGATDAEILKYIAEEYRLVILTTAEAAALDQVNRTKIAADRLAGVALRRRGKAA